MNHIRHWLRERTLRSLNTRIVLQAEAALVAHGRDDKSAYRRFADEAQRLRAQRDAVLRRPPFQIQRCHVWRVLFLLAAVEVGAAVLLFIHLKGNP